MKIQAYYSDADIHNSCLLLPSSLIATENP